MKRTLQTLIFVLFSLSVLSQSIYQDKGQMAFSFEPGAGYIQDWNPSTVSDNDWRISRVPLAQRFTYAPSQIDPTQDTEREYCLWAIMPTSVRSNENFYRAVPYMMQYRDVYALWVSGGGKLELPAPQIVDGCHRNGTKVTANITFADGTYHNENRWKAVFQKNSNGQFIHPKKIVEICKYYNIDGLSINFEVNTMSSYADITHTTAIAWMQAVIDEAAAQGLDDFELLKYWVWYNGGNRSWYIKGVDSSSDSWLKYNNKTTSTMAFLNYEWNGSGCAAATSHLPSIGRSTYDNFVGVSFYGDKTWDFAAAKSYPVSWGFWGEPSLKSYDDPYVMPSNPTELDEELHVIDSNIKFFAGATNNPKNATNAYATYSPAKFGAADVFPARSTINSIPFHSYFSLGNGRAFFADGQKVREQKWSDYGISDLSPTWCWYWKIGGNGLNTVYDYNDAYYAGNSIKITGSIPSGNNELKLYKTKLSVDGTTKLYLTYKVSETENVDSHLDVTLEFENGTSLSSTSYLPVGTTSNSGWNTKEIDLSQFNGQTIAVVGINVSGSESNYSLNLGALRITNDNVTQPNAPVNVEVTDILSEEDEYSVLLNWDLPGSPKLNIDGNVDYFEVYQVNPENGERQLIGKSVHRGFVASGIKKMPNVEKLIFQVASVAADGLVKTFSDNIEPISADFSIDNRYVAPGTSINLQAVTSEASQYTWEIEGPTSQSASGENVSISIDTPGFYSVTLTIEKNSQTISRQKYGCIQVIEGYTNLSNDLNGTITASTQAVSEGESVNFDYTANNVAVTFKKGIALTSSDRAGVSKAVLGSSSSWTISWWHNIENFYAGSCQFMRNQNSNDTNDWIITLTENGFLKLNADTLLASKNIAIGEWNMYTMSYDGDSLKFYFNGFKTFQKALAINTTADSNGNIYFKNAPYAGKADEIQIYNRELTETEVLNLNTQPEASTNGLVFYCSCDETLNNIVNDNNLTYYANGSTTVEPTYVKGAPWFFTIGGDLTYQWTFDGGTPATSNVKNPSITYANAGLFDVNVTISDGVDEVTVSQTDYIQVTNGTSIVPVKIETNTITATENWQTVTLANTYSNMVVVATPSYSSLSDDPAIIRIRNAQNNSFEIKAQKAGSGNLNRSVFTHFIVAEEGVYTEEQNGVKMEAVKATSTSSYYKWGSNSLLEQRTFNNSYTQPVVVGQVMSHNDSNWSCFYSCNASRGVISSSSFFAGKHVGEDSNKTRADETIGYIVFEEETGEIANYNFVAVNDGPVQSFQKTNNYNSLQLPANNLSGNVNGVCSMDGLIFSNCGWANWWSNNALSVNSVNLSLDEDVSADTERIHNNEQVSFILLSEKTAGLKSASIGNGKNQQVEKTISAYPNPCQSVLTISGVEDDQFYSLFSLSGSKISEGKLVNKQIKLSGINKGMYILKINNQVIKVLKK